jgi:hypothetical protein
MLFFVAVLIKEWPLSKWLSKWLLLLTQGKQKAVFVDFCRWRLGSSRGCALSTRNGRVSRRGGALRWDPRPPPVRPTGHRTERAAARRED